MKIVAAETAVVEIPFHLRGTGVGIMPTAWRSLEFALVRLVDDLGNVGWGEGFGYFTVDATKATVMPHSPYFGPGFYASLHLAAARPAIQALEYNFVQPEAWLSDIPGLRHGGELAIPQTPGLGFEPDPEVMRRYRRA